MDGKQNAAIIGVWIDQSTGEKLLSVKSPAGIIIVALAGIWLSWGTKYLKKIFGNIALWFHLPLREQRRDEGSEEASETDSLLGRASGNPAVKSKRPLARLFKEKSGIRDLFAEAFMSDDLLAGDKVRLGVFTVFVACAAIGIIVGGYFLTKIKVEGPNLLASNQCGLWLFEGEKRSDAATRARMLDLEKEERAAQFGEDCYQRSGPIASRCNVFYKPKLPVSDAIYTNDCPFKNGICRRNQTVTFQTPTIDARDLGINSLSTPKFRRKNVCTPLNMDYPYIQNTTENGTTTFTYHYGTKYDGGDRVNYTYKTVGNPWDRLAPVYDVFTYSSNADDSDHPVWKPHPDLTHDKYSTVTIIFVSSLRILYEDRSDDPIFPADEEWSIPGDPRPWFRNSDPRARPFACINTVDVCAPDGTTCWNINEPTNNATISDDTPEFILLYSALFKTDIYYSLAKRQGRALLAQKKVSQYFSTALGSDYWVDEVQNLVQTALARTSINVWSVASGEDSIHEGRDGFIEKAKGYDLCGKYKFNPRGYQSIHFRPLIVIASLLPAIWVLSWDWNPIRRRGITFWDALKQRVKNAIVKLRAQGASSRQRGNSSGNNSSTLRSNNPPAATSTPTRPDTAEAGPATSSEEARPTSHIDAAPRGRNGDHDPTRSFEAEAPTVSIMQQQEDASRRNSEHSTPGDVAAEIPNTRNEEKTEWEPLVWQILLYFFFWLVIQLLYFIVMLFWIPTTFLQRACGRRNRAS